LANTTEDDLDMPDLFSDMPALLSDEDICIKPSTPSTSEATANYMPMEEYQLLPTKHLEIEVPVMHIEDNYLPR
jgi:hypothetical protein